VSVDVAPAVLSTLRRLPTTPGSNLVISQPPNWRFVLPSLEVGHLLCIGVPGRHRLRALGEVADRVTVLRPPRTWGRWRRIRRPRDLRVRPTEGAPLPGPTAVDLIVVVGRRGRRHAAERRARGELTGTVVYEERLRVGGRALRADDVDGPGATIWLRPAVGAVHAAAPAYDRDAVAFLAAGRHDRRAGGGHVGRKVLRRVLDHDAVRGRLHRVAVIRSDGDPRRLPDYVRRAAAGGGVDLGGAAWAMSAPGRYRSKKVVFFAFEDGELAHVVKVTRSPDLNHRLENEWDGLRRLTAVGMDGVPRATFLDHHAGLAVLGQAPLVGRPLRPSLGVDGIDELRAAARWFEDLAARTVRRVAAREVADALAPLLARCVELYALGPEVAAVLDEHLRRLREHPAPFPLVLQHGDPGAWNVLRTADGSLAWLDWEATEPSGMPLWDLFHFSRSYGVGAARAEGGRQGSLGAFRRVFLPGSQLVDALAVAVGDHVAQLGLDDELVEPLFHLCWMHRAVKEATRLPAARLASGHYVRLLQLGLHERNAPGLQALFGARPRPRAAAAATRTGTLAPTGAGDEPHAEPFGASRHGTRTPCP
jgi:hypothetical protein